MRHLPTLLVLLLAFALLPWPLGDGGGVRTLPEDRFVLADNGRLAARAHESRLDALARVAAAPEAGWAGANDSVGESSGALSTARSRPLGNVLCALVRAAPRDRVGTTARLVAALLVLVAVGLTGVAAGAAGSRRAGLLAGILLAVAPAALVWAAWSARLPVAAACAAAAGVAALLAPRDGGGPRIGRLVAASLLAAAAALFHEVGFGAVAAATVLAAAACGGRGGSLRPFVTGALVALPGAVVAALHFAVTSEFAPERGARPDVLDGAVAALLAWAAPLLPGHLHVAGGAAVGSAWARPVAAVLALFGVWLIVRTVRRSGRGSVAADGSGPWWAASVAAALPLLALARGGGSVHVAWYSAAVLPFLCVAVATGAVAAARRGGALRIAATVSLAGLVAAGCAVRLRARAAFADVDAFIALAARAESGLSTADAWALSRRTELLERRGDATDDERAALSAEAARLRDVVATGDGALSAVGARWLRDAPAARALASALARATVFVSQRPRSDDDVGGAVALDALGQERTAAALSRLAPRWPEGRLVRARAHVAVGSLAAAADALAEARELGADPLVTVVEEARLRRDLGRPGDALPALLAVWHAERARVAEDRSGTARVPRELVLALAETLSHHAPVRGGVAAFEEAAELIQPHIDGGDRDIDLRRVAYDLYLNYGDALVSLDRTALARIAYGRAVDASGPRSRAAEHLAWLDRRLASELADAQRGLAAAAREDSGAGVADAMLALGVAFARAGRWDEAAEVFDRIESQQGGVNPPLRLARAVHLYAARSDRLDVAKRELETVLAEDPTIAEARYRLAHVLLQLGARDAAAVELERAAREGADREWAAEALELAARIRANDATQ